MKKEVAKLANRIRQITARMRAVIAISHAERTGQRDRLNSEHLPRWPVLSAWRV